MHKVVIFFSSLLFAVLISSPFFIVGWHVGSQVYFGCDDGYLCQLKAIYYALGFGYVGLALGSNLGIVISAHKLYRQRMKSVIYSTIQGTLASGLILSFIVNLNDNNSSNRNSLWIFIPALVISIILPILSAWWGLRNPKIYSHQSIINSLRKEGWRD